MDDNGVEFVKNNDASTIYLPGYYNICELIFRKIGTDSKIKINIADEELLLDVKDGINVVSLNLGKNIDRLFIKSPMHLYEIFLMKNDWVNNILAKNMTYVR